MVIPIIPIICTIIVFALLWWVIHEFVTDPMILKVARVVIVVLVVFWLVDILMGGGFNRISFR